MLLILPVISLLPAITSCSAWFGKGVRALFHPFFKTLNVLLEKGL